MKKKMIALMSLMTLASPALAGSAIEPITLLGVSVTQKSVTFQVPSGGCTNESTVLPSLTQTGGQPAVLTLYSTQPDLCEAYLPEGVEITYSLEELAIPAELPFVIGNSISVRK